MSRLIKPQEIDQFERILRVPEAAISEEVATGVRRLDERRELEPALQEVLSDPNETPHGPTEIVDVLTTRVILRGERTLAAFILKGKGSQQVRSKDMAHQLFKARGVPGLGLLVLCVVGDLQDDAQRDFVTTALDADVDYLILDRTDTARLLIAYEKVCGRDGTRYSDEGICGHGHALDEGTRLEVRVSEGLKYEIPKLEDVSHAGAKRYSAVLLVDRHYDRESLRQVIQRAVPEVRRANYHRNEMVKARWQGTDAHVVWLFLGCSLEDLRGSTWRARAQWIDEDLSAGWRPVALKADEVVDGIGINWNFNYDFLTGWNSSHSLGKGEALELLEPLVHRAIDLGSAALDLFERKRAGAIGEKRFVSEMRRQLAQVEEVTRESGNIGFPPADLENYDQACQAIFTTVSNLYLPFNDRGLEIWDEARRDSMMSLYGRVFREDVEAWRHEAKRLH